MLYIANHTPHAISLLDEDGNMRIIEPTRPPVRVLSTTGEEIDSIQGVPIHEPSSFDGIVGLPPQRHRTLVIVSQIAAFAIAATMPERTDVVYPDTGPNSGASRASGRILSVKRLIRAT